MAESVPAGVAVIGAGPAGIAAAVRAAESGANVLLVDDARSPGGQIWRHAAGAALPPKARRWLARLSRSGARRLRATAVASPGERELLLEDGEGRAVHLRYDTLVLATGARELFLPFAGWTLPGVVGVGAAEALVRSGVSFEGQRVVVAGSGPLLLPAAAALAGSGARVRTIAEQAPSRRVGAFALRLALRPGKLAEAIQYRLRFLSARYRTGTWVAAARADSENARVREVVLTDGEKTWTEPCDLLCCGFGLVPNVELPRLLGCEVEDGRVRVDEAQRTSVPRVFCAGEVTGIGGADLALADGQTAGLAAAGSSEHPSRHRRDHSSHLRFARAISRAFALRDELRRLSDASTILCRCEDVRFGALDPAWSARQAKLYARLGMGPCQGRVCGPALRFLFGWEPDSVRPPVSPVPLSLLRSAAGASSVSGGEEVIHA